MPRERNNIVYKAVESLLGQNPEESVEIKIEKNIPSGAGLGGASSNAACVLLGLNKLFKFNYSKEYLIDIASKIGSDVPFFINGGCALVEGRGEKLTKLQTLSSDYEILLVKPNISISTGEAYQELDKFKNENKCDWNREKVSNLLDFICNDFDPWANEKYEEIRELKDIADNLGHQLWLTGSGSALYTVGEHGSLKLLKEEFDSIDAISYIARFNSVGVKEL